MSTLSINHSEFPSGIRAATIYTPTGSVAGYRAYCGRNIHTFFTQLNSDIRRMGLFIDTLRFENAERILTSLVTNHDVQYNLRFLTPGSEIIFNIYDRSLYLTSQRAAMESLRHDLRSFRITVVGI